MIANGGGIHVGDDSTVTIDNTRIDGNTVVVDDPAGQPAGFDAGMIVGVSTLTLRNSTVSDNRVIANVAATDDNGSSGSALEFDGVATIEQHPGHRQQHRRDERRRQCRRGRSDQRLRPGTAVRDPQQRDRQQHGQRDPPPPAPPPFRARASRTTGCSSSATCASRGTLRRPRGPTGFAQGGGIWNGVLFNPPPVQLILVNTRVAQNTITASPGDRRSKEPGSSRSSRSRSPTAESKGTRQTTAPVADAPEPVSGRDDARQVRLSRVATLA